MDILKVMSVKRHEAFKIIFSSFYFVKYFSFYVDLFSFLCYTYFSCMGSREFHGGHAWSCGPVALAELSAGAFLV